MADLSVRPPAVAGMFYPGSMATLSRQVAGFLAQAPAPKASARANRQGPRAPPQTRRVPLLMGSGGPSGSRCPGP